MHGERPTYDPLLSGMNLSRAESSGVYMYLFVQTCRMEIPTRYLDGWKLSIHENGEASR